MSGTYRIDEPHAMRAPLTATQSLDGSFRTDFHDRRQDVQAYVQAMQVSQADRPATCSPEFELCTATERDHAAIHRFLVAVFQQPSRQQFQHENEAPRYEALDRILFQRRNEITAHLQLVHRSLQFGEMTVPAIDLRNLGTLPEYRLRGLASNLLHAAEHDMNLHGAILATVNSRAPIYFLRRGWVPWLQHCQSAASPRSLLAELELPPLSPSPHLKRAKPSDVTIRLWRRHELDALQRLYNSQSAKRFGGLARDEADWDWLISGSAHERIYVAVKRTGQSRPINNLSQADETHYDVGDGGEIIGYAVIRHDRIVELIAEPETGAAVQLLKHVCADCIENGHHTIRLDAAPDDPLHDQFHAASGVHRQLPQKDGRMLMAKLLRPVEFLRRLGPTLGARAAAASVDLPAQLGLVVGDRQMRINLGKRQTTVVEGKIPVDSLTFDMQGFNMLLLGQADMPQLISYDRAYAATRTALELSKALFPMLPGWRMPWEDLPPLSR